jgi:hypothetical protein
MHSPYSIRHRQVRAFLVFLLGWWVMAGSLEAQQPPQTIRIDSVDAAKTRRSLEDVKVQLQNVTSQPQTGIIWYVLAAPGEKEPWRVNAYSSPEMTVQLATGETRTVVLPGPDRDLDGRFELSVWLHGVNRVSAERFFDDYRVVQEPLLVAPRFSFTVDGIGTVEDDGLSLAVRFTVRNNDKDSANIGIRYQVGETGAKAPPNVPFARTARIGPGVDYVITIRHATTLSPKGHFVVTGWLYELTEGQMIPRATDDGAVEVAKRSH